MSSMRLYGGIIAMVSGGYSLYLATGVGMMRAPQWFMLILGLVVLLHGVLLLALGIWMGAGSGIAMIVYSVLMLLNQGWMGMTGMMTITMGWNPGMIAIAAMMLASGLIMTMSRNTM